MLRTSQLALAAGLAVSVPSAFDAAATSVLFDTEFGDITVDLFEAEVPATVENFLGYVERGDYTDTLIHRSIPGFVVQGGGFRVTDAFNDQTPSDGFERVPTLDPVVNEPGLSNVRGTIALARTGETDSGTNQFFFNLTDNNASNPDGNDLDQRNGDPADGFTVFGEIIDGLDVIEAIAALPTQPVGGGFDDFPTERPVSPGNFDLADLVLVNSVSLLEEVEPVIIDTPVTPDPTDGNGDGDDPSDGPTTDAPGSPDVPDVPVTVLDDPPAPTDTPDLTGTDDDLSGDGPAVADGGENAPAAVPAPSAAVAGLLGLVGLATRRRRG